MMDKELLQSPYELELFLKADRRLKNVNIIEAPASNLYVLCLRPALWHRLRCFVSKGYKELFRLAFSAIVKEKLDVAISTEICIVI